MHFVLTDVVGILRQQNIISYDRKITHCDVSEKRILRYNHVFHVDYTIELFYVKKRCKLHHLATYVIEKDTFLPSFESVQVCTNPASTFRHVCLFQMLVFVLARSNIYVQLS